jgi:regulatory protein
MPSITSIKQQQKRSDRYSIYIDGKYTFSLSELELINHGLRINQELSDAEFAKLKDTAVVDKAYDRALNLISHRARSIREMEDYLRRKDYDEAIRHTVISRLSERGYLNDESFAQAWVEHRRALRNFSKRRLQQELRQKGLSADIIARALSTEDVDERGVLKDLILKKRRLAKYQDDEKLTAYLARQGFNYSDIKEAIASVAEELAA